MHASRVIYGTCKRSSKTQRFRSLLQNLTDDVQEVLCWKTVRQEQPEKICSLSVKDAESVYEESRDRTANVMTRWTRTEPRKQRNGQREGRTFPNPSGSRDVAHVVSQALQLTNLVRNATEVRRTICRLTEKHKRAMFTKMGQTSAK